MRCESDAAAADRPGALASDDQGCAVVAVKAQGAGDHGVTGGVVAQHVDGLGRTGGVGGAIGSCDGQRVSRNCVSLVSSAGWIDSLGTCCAGQQVSGKVDQIVGCQQVQVQCARVAGRDTANSNPVGICANLENR